MDIQKINIYRIKKEPNEILANEVEKIMQELREFYGLDWTEYLPKVVFLENRELIDIFYGKKTEDWVVGWSGKDKMVYLLDQEKTGIESKSKYGNKEYRALIKHELAHAFNAALVGYALCPVWLNDGICIFASGQLETDRYIKTKPAEFKNFLNYFNKQDSGVYEESGWAVKILVDKFGKDKIMALLAQIKTVKPDEESFKKIFKDIYEIELSYENINRLVVI